MGGGYPVDDVTVMLQPYGGAYAPLLERMAVATGLILGEDVLIVDPAYFVREQLAAQGSADQPALLAARAPVRLPEAAAQAPYPVTRAKGTFRPGSSPGVQQSMSEGRSSSSSSSSSSSPKMEFAHGYERYASSRRRGEARAQYIGTVQPVASRADEGMSRSMSSGRASVAASSISSSSSGSGEQQMLCGFDLRRRMASGFLKSLASARLRVVQYDAHSERSVARPACDSQVPKEAGVYGTHPVELSYGAAYDSIVRWLDWKGSERPARVVVTGIGSAVWATSLNTHAASEDPVGRQVGRTDVRTISLFLQRLRNILALRAPQCAVVCTVDPGLSRECFAEAGCLSSLVHSAGFLFCLEPFSAGGGGARPGGVPPPTCQDWDGTIQLRKPHSCIRGAQRTFLFCISASKGTFIADRLRLGPEETRDEEAALGGREKEPAVPVDALAQYRRPGQRPLCVMPAA